MILTKWQLAIIAEVSFGDWLEQAALALFEQYSESIPRCPQVLR